MYYGVVADRLFSLIVAVLIEGFVFHCKHVLHADKYVFGTIYIEICMCIVSRSTTAYSVDIW